MSEEKASTGMITHTMGEKKRNGDSEQGFRIQDSAEAGTCDDKCLGGHKSLLQKIIEILEKALDCPSYVEWCLYHLVCKLKEKLIPKVEELGTTAPIFPTCH